MAPLWSSPAVVGSILAWWLALPASRVYADQIFTNDVKEFNQLTHAHHNRPHQTFRSSNIIGPVFNVDKWDRSLTDNSTHIFLGTRYGEYNDYLAGPMILDASDLSLVYAAQKYKGAFASTPQVVNGTQYLVFWDGLPGEGYALGNVLVVDEEYNLKYNLTSVGASGADMHEAALTDEGTAIFTLYHKKPWDTTSLGGGLHGSILDSGFQEVNLETNELIFEWYASDFFDITDSLREFYGDEFDFAHINSVEKTSNGNYLVSSRHLSSVILVDGNDGHPIWVMGGRRNEFKDVSGGKALSFGWQHQVRFHGDQNHITMFDNHDRLTGPCGNKCVTRGLELTVNSMNKTVGVFKEFYHPRNVNTAAQGGMQMLPNGNAILGFGYVPGYVEFTSSGQVALDFQRSRIDLEESHNNGMNAYRISKGNWVGRPSWRPSIAVDAPHGTVEGATLYLSWNGATGIIRWAIYSSDEPGDIHKFESHIDDFDRSGFETTAFLGHDHRARYVSAVAIDRAGEALGATRILDIETSQSAGELSISQLELVSESAGSDMVEVDNEEEGKWEEEGGQGEEQGESGGTEEGSSEEADQEISNVDEQNSNQNGQEKQEPGDEEDSETNGEGPSRSSAFAVGSGVIFVAGGVSAVLYWRRRKSQRQYQQESYKALATVTEEEVDERV